MVKRLRRTDRKKEITEEKIQIVEPHSLSTVSEFILTIVNSSRVEGSEYPLSAIIDEYPVKSKRKLFSKYYHTKGIKVISVAKRNGITEFEDEIREGKIKYFIVPDIDKLIQGRKYGSWKFLYGLDNLSKEGLDNEIPFGFICASPPSYFGTLIHRWNKWMGLMTGLFPFLFGDGSEDTNGTSKAARPRSLPFTVNLEEKVDVSIKRRQIVKIKGLLRFIERLNDTFQSCISSEDLIVFAQAHALVRGDDKVTPTDIKFIESLIPFWIKPGGNDCQFFIMRTLPGTVRMLASKLPYPESRIEKELGELMKREIISRDKRGGKNYYYF